MTKQLLLISFFLAFLLAVFTSCGGVSDPIAGNQSKTDVPVLGLNTQGLSIDGNEVDPDLWNYTVSPGSRHLITFDAFKEAGGGIFRAQCSGGSWVIDGENSGNDVSTDEASIEWMAPYSECSVQIIFYPPGGSSGDGIKYGMMLVVSDSWYMVPRPYEPYERVISFVNSSSGESILAVEGELLVKLRSDESLTAISSLRTAQDYQVLEKISNGEPVYRLRLDPSADLASAMEEIASDPRVEVVEPNYLADIAVVPTDPDYGLKHEYPAIDAEQAWDIATGSEDVWVAVVDTGVDRNHPDLAHNVVPGVDLILGGDGLGGETPGDGVDNNQDGIVDQNVGHGTHVAGIIAAQAFNGKGACGIAFNTKIFPLRIFPTNGDTGATFSSIIEAIERAAEEPRVRVISMSIATTYNSTLLQEAVNDAWGAGKLLVAAAANSNTDVKYYPAAHDHVLAVAAINKVGSKASFSNYGAWVDISAYGTGIYSTYFDDSYTYMSGTSMACPLVSGCAALLFSYDLTLTNEECVAILTTFADDVDSSNPNYAGLLGSGLVNPYLALDGMAHSKPGEVGDADGNGSYSDTGIELGPGTQG